MQVEVEISVSDCTEDVLAFYRKSGYRSKPNRGDTLVIATFQNAIVGAVRICWEKGFTVLRGVRVLPEWQGRGIGSRLVERAIRVAQEEKGEDIFIIPYRHLIGFYERMGFRALPSEHAPAIVRARYKKYCGMGYDVVVMRKISSSQKP